MWIECISRSGTGTVVDDFAHIFVDGIPLPNILADEREKAIEECKEVVRQHWINGTVAHRIAEEIYGDLEQLKEKK